MNFSEMADKRFSVKKYSSKPVEKEKLNKILETAGKAPTAKNAQCVRIYVLQSEEALKKASEVTVCTYGAPVVLLFTYDKDEAYVYPDQTERNSGSEDASIVAVHVMYEALEQGLGTCWINRFNPDQAKKTFNLPDNEEAVLLMDLGYADPAFRPLPQHTTKKPLSDIVRYL